MGAKAVTLEDRSVAVTRAKTKRWADRKLKILSVASTHINRFGPADIDLKLIAEDCAMSRSTLYHYVADRADLVEACLDQSISHLEQAMALAASKHVAIDAIETLVTCSLDRQGRYTCALSDFEFLGRERSKPLTSRAKSLRSELVAIIASGMAQGSFSSSDPHIAADLILGAINWTKVAAIWGSFADEDRVWQQASSALVSLAISGIANDGRAFNLTEAPIQNVVPDPLLGMSAFDPDLRMRARKEEICRVATNMFNDCGIGATTIEDIARNLGVTTGAIYHSFASKEDLIHACYVRSYGIYASFVGFVEKEQFSGIEQVYNLLMCHVFSQIGPWSTMRGQSGIEGLGRPGKDEIMARHRDIVARSSRFYSNAIQDGDARGGDPLLLSSAAAGAISWLPFRDREEESSALAQSRMVARQLLHGLAARQ